MRIIFTGKSDFTYNRTAVLLNGLKKLKQVEIIEYPIHLRKNFDKNEFRKLSGKTDFVYIPPFRHRDVRFISKFSEAPVVFDPLVSLYLSKVVDYKHWWKAPVKYWQDMRSFHASDILIAETQANKNYYIRKLRIEAEKIHCLYIGVDTEIFHPSDQNEVNTSFNVGFYGSFIPLQGIERIIQAAELLKNEKEIVFHLIGSGYGFEKIKKQVAEKKLNQVKFHGWIPHQRLPEHISKFDLCLGIFGDSLKSDCVIPNKIFHYAAMRKCILTKDTPAIKEIFTNGKDIVLCRNEAEEIAGRILEIRKNQSDYDRIAEQSFLKISQEFNEVKIAESFIQILEHSG